MSEILRVTVEPVERAVAEGIAVEQAPKARRCEALTSSGQPCRAYAIKDSQLCNAHQRLADGRPYFGELTPAEAGQAKAKNMRARAELRRMLLPSGQLTPRAVLRAEVIRQQQPLATKIVEEAMGNGVAGAQLGLSLIREVDPPVEATLSVELPTNEDELNSLSMGQLLRLAEQHGIEAAPPELLPAEQVQAASPAAPSA